MAGQRHTLHCKAKEKRLRLQQVQRQPAAPLGLTPSAGRELVRVDVDDDRSSMLQEKCCCTPGANIADVRFSVPSPALLRAARRGLSAGYERETGLSGARSPARSEGRRPRHAARQAGRRALDLPPRADVSGERSPSRSACGMSPSIGWGQEVALEGPVPRARLALDAPPVGHAREKGLETRRRHRSSQFVKLVACLQFRMRRHRR
ncbi:hypothetical protein M728_005452 (plasmid) [Ensifer sp. WSM1721]